MPRELTVGSLFAGIGGFDLGLERAGMRVLWQCDNDAYAQRVLAKHWPDVLRVPDIRHVGAGTVPYVDVICGGFPCQDLSLAGKGAGLDGARSGLWSEYARVVGELRPRYVVVENVRALVVRGLDRVLADLAAIGYDAEWDCIPASAIGAPHQRDRVWIVAYPSSQGLEGHGSARGDAAQVADARSSSAARSLADAEGIGFRPGLREDEPEGFGRGRPGDIGGAADPWATEPDVGRVAHGVPDRVDRLRALGNALVPQIAEWIGRRILEHERGELADAA